MKLALHTVCTMANAGCAILLIGAGVNAPTGDLGMLCAAGVALCAVNAYAHVLLLVTA